MSEPELPGLGFSAALVLVAGPFLLLALRFAPTLLPAGARPLHRWTRGEIVAVCLTPFALFALFGALSAVAFGRPSVFVSLLVNELVLGATCALILFVAREREQGLANLGFGPRVPARAFLAAPIAYLPWLFVQLGVSYAWLHLCRARGWEEQQEVMLQVLALHGSQFLVASVIVALVGPLFEELFFRGFLQSALAQALGERGALVSTSVIFAALHGMAALPVLFGLSLFFGWLQQRTRSLWVPWSAHAFYNATSLGLALALQDHAG